MKHVSEFIVLAATKVGDKSLVLHTLSPAWGRRSFITSVSAKAPMALFQPLSMLEAEVVENSKSDLWRLKEIRCTAPLHGLRSDLRKSTMSLFLSEVLLRTIKDGMNEPGLYEWCAGSILTLDAMQSDFSNFHLRFLLELAGRLGFSPSVEDLLPFAGEHLPVVKQLLTLGGAESMLIPMSGQQRNAVAGLLIDYISFHSESVVQIRSLAVLRELFS